MGVTEGAWRLKAILFVIVMMTLLYGSEAVFLNVSVEGTGTPDYSGIDLANQNLSEADTRELQQESSTDILGALGFVFSFATFSVPEMGMPLWASFFLTLFTISLVVTLVYVTYTFIYEFVKGLPFT